MRNIRFLIVLLAAMLIAPAAVLAASKIISAEADVARYDRFDVHVADAGNKRDKTEEEDHLDGDDDDSDSDDDDSDSDDDDGHKGKGKYKDKGKYKIKPGQKEGKHQAHSEIRGEHAERMKNAETAEERKAIADEMKAMRKDKSDRADNMGGKRRDVSLDEQAEKDAVRATSARRNAMAERLENAKTPEERQAIMEEMKAAKKGKADDKREMVREHQEGRKEMRTEQRADRAETKAVYAERMEAVETTEERKAIQEEMKTSRAEQQAERVEQQKEKKPWWKFWGD